MKYPKELSVWVRDALETIRVKHADLAPIAEKLAGEPSLAPLWRAIEKKFTGDEFWVGAGNFFAHLVRHIAVNLQPPAGYRSMSPAKLDEWRRRTQQDAMALLNDLMDGYPQILEKEDKAFVSDKWTVETSLHTMTNGEFSDLHELGSLVDSGKFDSERFAVAVMAAMRPHVMLTHLIAWLDFEAAEGHSVTHAAIPNAHRNSFIRRLTSFFELYLGKVMRTHVHGITGLYFDVEGLDVSDIKKIAPAGGGKIPKMFIGNLPRDDIP